MKGSLLSIRLPGNRLLRDVATTYAGFFANAILGFVTLALVAKRLGPGGFGVATLANMFMAVIAGLGEPGVGMALVRLAARPETTTRRVDELVVAAIRLELMLVAGVCGLAYVLMPWITGSFMHRPEITALLRWCLIGGGLLSLAGFAGALFQIRGAFRDNAAAIAVAGAVRTAVVVGLWCGGCLNLYTAVASMVLMNVVQCGMCLLALRPMLAALPWHCPTRRQMGELVHYGKYLVISLLAGTLHPRADMLLLSHYANNRSLGFYSAAAQLCMAVPMMTMAVNLVLMPRISALRTSPEMTRMMRNCGLGALAVFSLLAPVLLAAGPVVHLVFGGGYEAAVLPFQVLICAAAANLALSPFSNFWHALDRPAMLSALNTARLGLLVGVAIISIPRWGAIGAALAVLGSTALPLTGQGLLLWRLINSRAAPACHPPEWDRSAPAPVGADR